MHFAAIMHVACRDVHDRPPRPVGRVAVIDVSVVICAYSTERWEALLAAVESVRLQSAKTDDAFVELIVGGEDHKTGQEFDMDERSVIEILAKPISQESKCLKSEAAAVVAPRS